jgi:hypothetical protein
MMLKDATGELNADAYSRIDSVFVQRSTPIIFQGYAEVELMLTEAAVRGWIADDPAPHYKKGVTAAMQQLALLDASAVIPDAEIEAYLAENPYQPASTDAALELIHTQYWAATFLNWLETYANWRRTGYPVLTPANFPGNPTGGVIPRRLRYPLKEYSVNSENINEAVERQGADDFLTRVWWDR